MISLVYAYYENAKMFQIQQANWLSYPEHAQKEMEVIITDDCSAKNPLLPQDISTVGEYDFSLFFIQKKISWNWLEARNIGAKHAKYDWLLLTDMDHVVTPGVFEALLKKRHKFDPEIVYQFARVVAPGMTKYKPHNDSFFVSKKLFWKSGGYDEDYSGQYGTSGIFRRRLFSVAKKHKELSNLSLVLYPRDFVEDASTRDLPRKEGRDPTAIKHITAWKLSRRREIQLFAQPYERLV